MRNELTDFIENRCHQYAGAACRLVDFRDAFLRSLPPRLHRYWPRTRLIAELAQRYPLGKDRSKRLAIGGVALSPAPQWRVEGRRLVTT